MLHTQLFVDTAGTVINAYAVGSLGSIITGGVKTERDTQGQGILFVFTGTIASVTRQVSIDNVTYYTPYNLASDISLVVSGSMANSRFVSLTNVNSANVVVPWQRFTVKSVSGGTVTMTWVANEV